MQVVTAINFLNKPQDSIIEIKLKMDSQMMLEPMPELAPLYLKLGNIYKLKNDNKSASDYYKKSLLVNPEYPEGWFNLGLVQASENNISEAKKSFVRVIELNPEYAYAYYALAIAAETENNKPDALKYYKEFLKYNKDMMNVSEVEEKIKSLEK